MKNEKKLKRVLIMAGGTGGHVFPGLVVAEFLRHQSIDVHWLGTKKGLEARLVPAANFPLHFISIHGLRGKNWQSWFLAPFKILTAIIQAKRIIKNLQPDAVLGMGGFVSGPGGVACWWLQHDLVIHEQNAIAGLTNKILARLARCTLTGFPQAFTNHRSKQIAKQIGNPVRFELEQLPAPRQRFFPMREPTQPFRLLVLGGSLGAAAINQLIPQVLARLPVGLRPVIIHQTGEKHFNDTLLAYQKVNLITDTNLGISNHVAGIKIVPFIDDMQAAYLFADMVLCRAGALTLAELCAVGVGSIIVPYPYAVDDHQSANARFMSSQGASLAIPQMELTIDNLVEEINYFTAQPEKQLAMAEAAYRLRQVNVAEKIFNVLRSCSTFSRNE